VPALKAIEARVEVLMSRTPFSLGAALIIALAMWVIPSFGTQGVGAVGRELPHPDRALLSTGGIDVVTVDSRLHSADRAVRDALPH